jgi:hypothetical protein
LGPSGSVPDEFRELAEISLSAPAPFGMLESFNARLRDELLDGEIFYWRATTTRSGRMPHLDTSRQHRRLTADSTSMAFSVAMRAGDAALEDACAQLLQGHAVNRSLGVDVASKRASP